MNECEPCFIKRIRSNYTTSTDFRMICAFYVNNIQEKCPCLECLVKPICRKSCIERRKIYAVAVSKNEKRTKIL